MQTFHLYIKNRIRINLDAIVFFDVFRKAYLILALDLHKFLLFLRILCIRSKFCHLGEVCDPSLSNMFCYPVCKKWIGVCKESSLCDAVCFIVKFLRVHIIKIFQFLIHQNLGMKFCNSVYRKTGCNCKVCHLNLTIPENCHLLLFVFISRITVPDLNQESPVNFIHNLIYTRKQSLEDLNRPLLQCL